MGKLTAFRPRRRRTFFTPRLPASIVFAGLFAGGLWTACTTDNSGESCKSDVHCKGDRLCDIASGTCFSPDEFSGSNSSTNSTSTSSTGGNTGVGGASTGGSSTGGTMGTGGSGVVYVWSAGDPETDGTYTLPAWLTFSSPTDNKSAQTSLTTLRTGFGVDAARARDTGGGWGLMVESERTNLVTSSDDWAVGAGSGWVITNGMTISPGQADPAGGTAATRFQSPNTTSGFYSNYFQASARVVSTWARGAVGTDPFAHFRYADYYVDIVANSWLRVQLAHRGPGNHSFIPMNLETRNNPNGAGVITGPTETEVYGGQMEPDALYASSYIPTTTEPRTREAESLSTTEVEAIAGNGEAIIQIEYAARYASDDVDGGAEHDLVYISANDRLFARWVADPAEPTNVDKTTAIFCLKVEGEELCTDGLKWNREAQITVEASITSSGRSLDVAVAGGNTATVQAPDALVVDPETSIYILGGPGGAQQCADLRRIVFSKP